MCGEKKILHETDGRFSSRDKVFQPFFKLPQHLGYNVQLCTFTAEGAYAGSCIRADSSKVIVGSSDVFPLRILPDDEMFKS